MVHYGQRMGRRRCCAARKFGRNLVMVFPVLLIFMVGALCGGLIGYLIGYIKYHKKTSGDKRKTVAQQTMTPTLDVGVDHDQLLEEAKRPTPRLRGAKSKEISMRSQIPDKIVVTRTGLEESHIYHREDCHVTRSGTFSGTNIIFRKCDL